MYMEITYIILVTVHYILYVSAQEVLTQSIAFITEDLSRCD